MTISKVNLALEAPDNNATGRIRIESLISYDENDIELTNYQGLVNHEEDTTANMIEFVSQTLNVSSDIINII